MLKFNDSSAANANRTRFQIMCLHCYMRLNMNRDKTAVAHQKILTHHFPLDSTNIKVFVGMSAPVLPYAVEWICRDKIGLLLMNASFGGSVSVRA